MPASRFIVSSNQAAICAARLGWGYTRALSYQVAEAVARGELELVLEAFEPPAVPVHIIYQGGARSRPRYAPSSTFASRAFVSPRHCAQRDPPGAASGQHPAAARASWREPEPGWRALCR